MNNDNTDPERTPGAGKEYILKPIRMLRRFLQAGHSRSVKAKRNISALFILRGITALVNLLLVPMTLSYLNISRYGVWLTLTGIIGWAGFLDIGLGNGLRNRLAESIAKQDEHVGQIYVSTTYAFILMIIGASIVLFSLINPFLPWSEILNTSASMDPELRLLAYFVFLAFCLKLVFGLIGTILNAYQRPAAAGAIDAVASIVSLGCVWLLTQVIPGSLFWLGVAITAPMALAPILANVWFYARQYRGIRPRLQFVDKRFSKDLVNLGARFFVLQIAGIIVFSSANLLITQMFDPKEVAPYNIALKYYGVAATAFTIVLTPFWSAYTDAFVKKDIHWILNSLRRLRMLWAGLAVLVVLMTAGSGWFYEFWLRGREHVLIPFWLSAATGAYVLVMTWSNIYVNFINGVGKIRLQLWSGVITALIVVPLNILLAKTCGLGTTGVSLGMSLSLLPWCFVWPIQVRKILAGNASGIWNK